MMTLSIYKYLIEWLDEQTIKTYALDTGNFIVLQFHGSECYKLNGANNANYWQLWKNETGRTVDDLTDICVIWHEGFNIKNFFGAGKSAQAQTVSPTTWTSDELEKFFAFTNRQLKSQINVALNSTIRITTTEEKNFLVITLDKPYPFLGGQEFSPKPKFPKPTSKLPKPSASSIEIKDAWKVMSNGH